MAKKHLGYIELEWTCPSCGGRNAGKLVTCRTCGAAMPEDQEFELPAAADLDTTAETAARVAVGPDFLCPYCGARNQGDATRCIQCGGDLSEAARRAQGEIIGAYETGPVPMVACPHCGTENPASSTNCRSCGGTLGRPVSEPLEEPEPSVLPKKRSWLPIGCLVVLVLGALLLIFFSLGSSESTGVVRDVEWTYSIGILELRPVAHEGWHDEIPETAQVESCVTRVRRVEADPVPGAEEVCGTPYVRDTGTGKGEVMQDCEYHVAEEWCKYMVNEWLSGIPIQTSGSGFSPVWPRLQLAPGQREGSPSEEYRVKLLVDDAERIYAPRDLNEYRRFEIGSEWIVEINALGGITQIRPMD